MKIVLALALCLGFELAGAQTVAPFPTKPVRLLASEPGGSVDLVARTLGRRLSEMWGQPVIVDNRGGAGGVIYMEASMRAPADGYTLAIGHTGTLAISPAIDRKLPYDPERDFTPISLVLATPLVVVVHPGIAARSIPELIRLAREQPGTLSFASAGPGTASHLAGSWLADRAKVALLHVPFRGTGPALAGVVSGNVAMLFSAQASAAPLVQAGKLRALGVTGAKRSSEAPDMPTVAEQGLPGFEVVNWQGLIAPAGLPADLVAKLEADVKQALAHESVRSRLAFGGAEIVGSNAASFREFIRTEVVKWREVARTAAIVAE